LPDIWPVGDLAFRRGLAATFGLPRDISENNKADLAKMNEIGEQFKGYRSLVAVLMYKVYDAGKAEERKNSPKKAKKPKKE
jgi:3-methyladenine DNA glycosylase/8-oxoguanine DNA glycosylase